MLTLADLGTIYKPSIHALPKEEQLSWCNQWLDKIQNILEKNRILLNAYQKEQLRQMIQTAQNEMKKNNDG